ncbi:uncharacterized protein LOC111284416 [Durio zibethinus]|uniref:Uncharacterized protein LOC111284416 n=1 Tax=Durio zibethinus TaxID=66656 RepID=A0A6P5XLQ6_DURZI|nr:uncharacterized protein LOC111284416 [Durio zibethinus]
MDEDKLCYLFRSSVPFEGKSNIIYRAIYSAPRELKKAVGEHDGNSGLVFLVSTLKTKISAATKKVYFSFVCIQSMPSSEKRFLMLNYKTKSRTEEGEYERKQHWWTAEEQPIT